DRIHTYEYGLLGARGALLVGGDGDMTLAAFRTYAASRDIAREFPGALGFGVITRLRPGEEEAFIARERADGRPDFAIRRLTAHEGERWIIRYIEPTAPNAGAAGLDIASETSRAAAARAAMTSGQATLTAPITLVQATGARDRGFLLLLPVYRPGMPLGTIAERMAATTGWTYAPLVIDDVLAGTGRDDRPVELSIRDVTEDPEAEAFHRSAGFATSQLLTETLPIRIFG
ncbi:MAG TPA: histidine kinase, partial [Tistrella mobilis]|nr:histidine kinase [Tistrella mobilis]